MENKFYFWGAWQEIDDRFENSLYNLINQNYIKTNQKYLNYLLDEKNWLIANMGILNCLIDKEHKIGRCIVTDGLWFWSTEVVHYINNHNLLIPKKFITNIERNNCKVPNLSEKKKMELLKKIRELFNSATNIDYELWELY